MIIPTTQELSDQNLARLEAAMGQTAPVAEQAFLRVLAVVEAMLGTGLYKYAAERARQNLAMTATGEDLDLIGAGVSVTRKPAEAAALSAALPATTGTIIPSTTGFIGAANGMRYYLDAAATSVAGVVTLSMTAEETGTAGNLQVGDTLNLISPIAGASTTATVTALTNTGAEKETDEAYRARVLFALRAVTGGSNGTDYKVWSESVAGVLRAFPYGGKPHTLGLISFPGDRTVYIEADASIDPDGIAPVGLLDEVRTVLDNSPHALGLTNANLWVESITRSAATVEITNLVTPDGITTAVKDSIETALSVYFAGLSPYLSGIDLPQNRNDLITDLTVAGVVQDILDNVGASATRVRFKLSTTPYLSNYRIEPGELIKLAGVVYA
jgi:hypothetical protein